MDVVRFWDKTLNGGEGDWVVVSADNPLPTNASSSGGASSVKITDGTNILSVNADKSLNAKVSSDSEGVDNQTAPSKAIIIAGKHDNTVMVPEVWTYAGTDAWALTDKSLAVASIMAGFNGTSFDRLRVDGNKNLLTGVNTIPTVGAHANAWNNIAVAADGVSSSIDCQHVKQLSVFGNSSASGELVVQYSQDNTNWYDSQSQMMPVGNFGLDFPCGARYVRLKSKAASTITATIAGKG